MQIQRENARAGGGETVRDFLGTLWDALEKPFEDAVSDIRRRVVEEGWFGREVTPAELNVDVYAADAEPALGFRELMAAQAAIAPHEPETAADQPIDI